MAVRRWRQRSEWCRCHQPRNAKNGSNRSCKRQGFFRRAISGSTGLRTLDFGLLASKTGRKQVSVVSGHQACDTLPRAPQETNTEADGTARSWDYRWEKQAAGLATASQPSLSFRDLKASQLRRRPVTATSLLDDGLLPMGRSPPSICLC